MDIEELDPDYQRVLDMTLNERRTQPIKVPTLQNFETTRRKVKIDFLPSSDDDDAEYVINEVPSAFLPTEPLKLKKPKERINSTISQSSFTSEVSQLDASDDDDSEPPPKIEIEKSDFPYIPPLATDLVQFIATIPDSAPASLSPYTFCEEVISLPEEEFEQFLEEDTLFIKSITLGGRFSDDSLFEFFNSLNDIQHFLTSKVVYTQYLKLSTIANFIRDLLQYDNGPEAAAAIEDFLVDIFHVRTAMVWLNIPSAKTLVNHSKLMRYPHGVGFVGTAASEKRQVVAPNPTRSPIYSEEYDLPFCEDSELIVAEPIVDPETDELYAVLLLIDKVHPSGASYMYWPQSELALLKFFSEGAYRAFRRIIDTYVNTAKMYKVIAKFISKQLDFFKLLITVKSNTEHLLNCEDVTIYFKDNKEVFYFELHGNQMQRKTAPLSKAGISGYVFKQKVFVNCATACDHPAFYSLADGEYKSRPVLSIPLMNRNEVFAVITCRAKKQSPCFDSDDVLRLSFIAAGATPALQMSMQYRKKLNELRVALRAQDRLAALLQAAEGLSRETNIDKLVGEILLKSCQLVGADRASLFQVDDARQNLISRVAHGTTKPFILPINQGIVGTVASTGETINIPDCYEDARFNANVDKATGYHTKSLMTIPVVDQNKNIIAVAQLMNKLNGEPFTESDVELTKAMCVFTGIALANSIVIQSAVNSSKRVQAMLDTVIMLGGGEALSGVLHHIMSTSRDLIESDRCSLFMIDMKGSKLQSTVVDGQKSAIEVSAGKGIVGYVAEHGEVVNIPDAYKDPRFHSGVDKSTGYRTRSILAAPVKSSDGDVIGVVEMINKNIIVNGGHFTEEDEKMTQAFATFAGFAFDKHSKRKTDTHSLAIALSNMMTSEESNSCDPPRQIAMPDDQMDLMNTYRFDVERLSNVDKLRFVASCFYSLKFSSEFQINNSKLIRFLLAINDGYQTSTFYSWDRAVESVQFIYYLLRSTEVGTILTSKEKLALFIAAICHDIDTYSQEENDPAGTEVALSILYRNRPVMEMHHCEQTIAIMSNPDNNILDSLTGDDQQEVWNMIIQLVLGTNMTRHFTFMRGFQSLVIPNVMLNTKMAAHRMQIATLALKLSDASYTCRSFQVCQKRAMRAYKMFTKKQIVGRLFNRFFHNDQIGFMLFISRPMARLLITVVPGLKPCYEQMQGNLEEWKRSPE